MSKRPRTKDELNQYIGSKIKEARIDNRIVGEPKKIMTQTQIAHVCDVTFQQIQK